MTNIGMETHDVSTVRPSVLEPFRARTLSVVIPAYNEEEILRQTVAAIHPRVASLGLDSFEILLCENGSTDDTLAIAHELSEEIPEVRVLSSELADYGAAMRDGFLASTGEAIVNFDADYYDLEFLAAALRVDADIVVAAKGIMGSHDTRVFLRRLVSRTFGWIVRSLLSVQVDETHGMKLFQQKSIGPLVPQVRSTKDLFDTELLALAEWRGLRIRALPIRTEELRHSRSGILRRVPRTLMGLVKMRLRLRKEHSVRVRPMRGKSDESYDVAV